MEVRPENPERRPAQGIDGRPSLPGERYTPRVSITADVKARLASAWHQRSCWPADSEHLGALGLGACSGVVETRSENGCRNGGCQIVRLCTDTRADAPALSRPGADVQVTIVMVAAAVHLWLWLDDECRRLAAQARHLALMPRLGRCVCLGSPCACAAARTRCEAELHVLCRMSSDRSAADCCGDRGCMKWLESGCTGAEGRRPVRHRHLPLRQRPRRGAAVWPRRPPGALLPCVH